MITYHNAIATNGQIVYSNDMTNEKHDVHYFCVGCLSEMIPM